MPQVESDICRQKSVDRKLVLVNFRMFSLMRQYLRVGGDMIELTQKRLKMDCFAMHVLALIVFISTATFASTFEFALLQGALGSGLEQKEPPSLRVHVVL